MPNTKKLNRSERGPDCFHEKKASKRTIMRHDHTMSCLLMPHPTKESKGFLAFKELWHQ